MALKVGDTAPDFELPAVEGERHLKIKLSDFLGKKNVVVSFHPLDWTPTCAAQVPAFNADREKFARLDAQVRGFLPPRPGVRTVRNSPQGTAFPRHQRARGVHRGQKREDRVRQGISARPGAE